MWVDPVGCGWVGGITNSRGGHCNPSHGHTIEYCKDISDYVSLAAGKGAAKKGRIIGSAGTFAKHKETGAVSNIDVTGHQITGEVMANSRFQQNITCVACINCAHGAEHGRDECFANQWTMVAIEQHCQKYLLISYIDCATQKCYIVRYNYQAEGFWCIDSANADCNWAPKVFRTVCIDDKKGYIVIATCVDNSCFDQLIFGFSTQPSGKDPKCQCPQDDSNYEAMCSCVANYFPKASLAVGTSFELTCPR